MLFPLTSSVDASRPPSPSTTTTGTCCPPRRGRQLRAARRPDQGQDLLDDAGEGPRRPARARPHHRDPRQPPAQAVLPGRARPRTTFADALPGGGGGQADEETAKLRDKYETKAKSLQDQLQAAQDRAEVLQAEASGRQQEELLSTAGSLLGSFLGGRSAAAAWPPSCGARRAGAPARVPPASASTPRRARRGASRPSSPSWRPTCPTTSSASLARGTRRRPPSTRCP